MGPAALVLAWIASLAPLLLERTGALDLALQEAGGTPRVALSSLAWIALAGLPRGSTGALDLRSWWGGVACCAPVLALALALDHAAGVPWERAAPVVATAFLLVALAALAADLARRRRAAHVLHALAWGAAVVGIPLLAAALAYGARRPQAQAPDWLRRLAGCSPLEWSLASASGAPSPWGALALAVLLCGLATAAGRREGA